VKSFWLFRSNLRQLESYHNYTNLKDFEENCHDFYILQIIWFLRNNIFDEGVVYRLKPKQLVKDIVFDINGKKLIQRFVDDFSECFKYKKPYISFFRGGFQEYDKVVLSNPSFFGLKLYLGAGQRVRPKHGGKYDKILVESEEDNISNSIPFYKTANPKIFRPLDKQKKYDLIWICNFSQSKYKGQKFFIKQIVSSSYLKSLKILHIGNQNKIGEKLCFDNGITNITFSGYLIRSEVNSYLNSGKFGIVTSDINDGCPRVSTEVMSSGTPLIIRDKTRLLNYYTKSGSVIIFKDEDLEKKIKISMENYEDLKTKASENVNEILSMDKICKKNLDLWSEPRV